ncbi:hypothetical protein F5884DRAFT_770188 [Xylogone sp. PMI_703]|nr:hypothetical protein F5884DRAFT_770188 [Xylogone sp. PMI_703]
MATSFESILLSRLITFIVGIDEDLFLVHEAVLVNQSPALAKMLGPDFNEANIEWKDVDKGTFIRFIQYAYTGDYTVPTMIVHEEALNGFFTEPPQQGESLVPPENERPSTPVPGDGTSSPFDGSYGWVSARKKKHRNTPKIYWDPDQGQTPEKAALAQESTLDFGTGENGDETTIFASTPKAKKVLKLKKKRSLQLPKSFSSLSYFISKPRNNYENTCDPRVERGSEENIGEVLRLHASLYVLADKWDVETLKTLSLYKLHKTLGMLRLDSTKVQYMVDLVQYVYAEGNTADLATGIDELRLLVCLYIADNSQLTSENDDFTMLLEDGGPFPRDLWRVTAARISPE